MHQIVANCFKAIAYAMIFVIVWDVGFYMWRVMVLNQRMEALTGSIQQIVSNNNYLPESDYETYKILFQDLAQQMNNGDTFVQGFNINYGKDSVSKTTVNVKKSGKTGTTNIVKYDMSKPADYGDVMTVEVQVGVNAVSWYNANNKSNATSFQSGRSQVILTYTYLVPCLKYITVR